MATVEQICQKMRALIESGSERDLACLVKQALNGVSAEQLLGYRYSDPVCVKRPSTGRDLVILRPNALMLAVASWFEDILLALARTRACLDDEFDVQDDSSVVQEFGGVTAVMVAAITGRERFLRVLINCGACVNRQNNLGDTPIYQACLEGHASVAELLIRNGGYLNLPNESGITPLMIACFVGSADAAELLLRYGARVDSRDHAGKSAAFYCVPAGAADCLRLLLRAGLALEPEAKGTSPLMEAAYQGCGDEMIDLLLAAAPGSAGAVDSAGRSALFYAVEGGNVAAFRRLLRAGVSAEPAQPSGVTLLMTAALRYRRQMAELLLDLGDEAAVGVRRRDAEGRTALFYCAANPEPDLLQLLLTCGVPTDPAPRDGSTLLMACIVRHNWSLVQFLLQRADALEPLVSLRSADAAGNTALSLAVEAQNQELLHQLIGMGARQVEGGRDLLVLACGCANADAALHFAGESPESAAALATDGRALLIQCVRGGHLDLTRHFLGLLGPSAAAAAEGDPEDGRNLFHEACAVGRVRMVQMLMAELPEELLLQRDASGRNALFYAVQSGEPRLLELLDGTPGLEPESDSRGVTLLMHALATGGPAVREHLQQRLGHYRQSEAATDGEGRGLLFYAAESNDWQLLLDTLDRGRPPSGLLSLEDADSRGRTLLMHSIERGAMATAQQLASRGREFGLDPCQADANGENALFYAVRARNHDLTVALLRHGVAPAPNARGQSVLALAYATGQGRMAELLLASAPLTPELLNGPDDRGCTAFHHLVIEQRLDHLARLAPLFDPLRDADERGENVLIKAARQANPRMTKLLLEAFPCDPGRVDAGGMNALSHAVLAGSFKTCKLLLAYGVRPLPETRDGSTLLHLGARSGNVQVFMHLLRFFVLNRDAVNAQDANGTSAAHLLCELGLWDCAEAFHRRGGRLGGEVRDKKGRTPMMLAALSNNLVLVKLLLQLCPASLPDTDSGGRTCLHFACQAPCPNPLVLRQLIDHRADVLAKDSDGFCPIHCAVQGTSAKAVQLLIDRGADPFKQTNAGANAFELCKQKGQGNLQVLEQLFRLEQAQSDAIGAYAKRLLEINLAELASQMARRDVILCEHNARVMELMNQQAERRDYLLDLVTRRGRAKVQDFLTELKPFSPQVAMELRAKLFVKPESEFMV